jgi:hypothetical protein
VAGEQPEDSFVDTANESTVNSEHQAETSTQKEERLFRQAELNEIVGRAKHEAVESYKRQHQNQASSSPPAMRSGMSEDDVRRLTSEELSRQRETWEKESRERMNAEAAERVVNAYREKIGAGKEKYQDFEQVTGNVDMRRYPHVVQLLADHVDNAHDVLYHLANNRSKMVNLEIAANHSPEDAIYEIQRLAKSIKSNEESSNAKTSRAPLSQQRPSISSVDSGGALSMADLKRKYKG